MTPTSSETNAYSTLTDFLKFILDDDLDLASQVRVHPLITQYHATNTTQREMLDHIKQGLYELNAIPRPVPVYDSVAERRRASGAGRVSIGAREIRERASRIVALTNAVVQRIS